jgi:hypothetical protein
MKQIPLSTGKVKGKRKYADKYVAIVDDEDYETVNKFYWSVCGKHNIYYAKSSIYLPCGKQKTIRMHRLIMGVNDPKKLVDHIDHNGLNNQRSNLRIATHQENSKNRTPYGSSKYLGVCWCKRSGRWLVQIKINKTTNKFLGYFNNEIDAAMVYDKYAKEIHGEFANLNFKPQFA